jgi:hypothetical protein
VSSVARHPCEHPCERRPLPLSRTRIRLHVACMRASPGRRSLRGVEADAGDGGQGAGAVVTGLWGGGCWWGRRLVGRGGGYRRTRRSCCGDMRGLRWATLFSLSPTYSHFHSHTRARTHTHTHIYASVGSVGKAAAAASATHTYSTRREGSLCCDGLCYARRVIMGQVFVQSGAGVYGGAAVMQQERERGG